MKLTRYGMFETNSSSSHVLSVADTPVGVMQTITPDENGVIKLEGGEFGWGYESYTDALTKANYLAVYAIEYYPEETWMRYTLMDVLREQTGAVDVQFLFEGQHGWDSPYSSYIDHQSRESDDCHYLFQDVQQMRQFLFNPFSELIIDNDNH